MFSPRQVIFSKLFYCSSRRQQKLSKKVVFLGFQTTRWAVFWRGSGTRSSFRGMVFPPGQQQQIQDPQQQQQLQQQRLLARQQQEQQQQHED